MVKKISWYCSCFRLPSFPSPPPPPTKKKKKKKYAELCCLYGACLDELGKLELLYLYGYTYPALSYKSCNQCFCLGYQILTCDLWIFIIFYGISRQIMDILLLYSIVAFFYIEIYSAIWELSLVVQLDATGRPDESLAVEIVGPLQPSYEQTSQNGKLLSFSLQKGQLRANACFQPLHSATLEVSVILWFLKQTYLCFSILNSIISALY